MSAVEQYEIDPPMRTATASRRPAVSARVPPHNLAAEESLLGAMLLSKDAIAAATEVGLAGDDFYKPAHGHIYTAICGLYSRGEPVDPVTVAEVLRRQELLDAIGGTAILVTLQAATPATTSAGRYARIVEEHALLRRLIGVAGEIAEAAYNVPDDVTQAIDRAESMVYDVAQRRVTDSMSIIGALLDENLNRLEALYERGEAVTGIPTGYNDLDEMLSGLQKSNLVVVGARPAMGKCLSADSTIVDPRTGEVRTIEQLVRDGAAGGDVEVPALAEETGTITTRSPSAFVDDGVKPTWTVRTKLGREVTATATHPFLTYRGWVALADLTVGDRIAVPRALPFFGSDELPDAEVKLLAYLIGDGGLTHGTAMFTTYCEAIRREVAEAAAAYGASLVRRGHASRSGDYSISVRRGQRNPVIAMLQRHGLFGVGSHAKHVPAAVFRLPKRHVALFLSRLFATDGSAWWTDAGDGYGRISYCSVSKRLARDVQHLLLRFGINAAIRQREVRYLDTRRRAYEVELRTSADIVTFADEIGIFSKEPAVASLATRCRTRLGKGWTADTLPVEAWGEVLAAKGARSWAEISAASGRPRNHNLHVGTRNPRRETVLELSRALDDTPLALRATSDVYWDEIVSIESAGEQQVYDLTVPELHNFVANDVCVHNTSFALGLAAHAALEARKPVLVFSLEMSQLELSQRILCSDARVDSTKVRTGKLSNADWGKISHSVGRLADAPIYIDDNANVTVMDIRAKARRMRSQLGDLGVIVIDYIQLMTGRSNAESRQVEVSEISRNLKILARELETPVIALAQLNRQLEQRADKRPMLSDLRESGCLAAGTRLLRADTGTEVTLGELLESGARNVPVWSLDDRWRLVPATLTHAFPSGTKQVFRLRLASGRTVEATANHRFRTLGDWVALGDLEVGSRIAVPRRVDAPEAIAPMDEDELVLLAHLLGDGCVLPRQPVHYTSADPANLDVVEEAAARRFGITPRRIGQQNWWHSYLAAPQHLTHGRRNPIAEWWDGLGLADRRSSAKFVPAPVFAVPDQQVALFLRHLWATDGSISLPAAGPKVRLSYSSSSRRLIDDVQLLLLRLGVQARITTVTELTGRPGYQLRIEGVEHQRRFLEGVGIHGARGRLVEPALALLDDVVANPNVDTIPFEVRSRIIEAMATAGMSQRALADAIDEQYCGSYLLGSPTRPRTSSRARLRRMAEALGDKDLHDLATSDVLWDRVVAIEPLGEQPVYDATVLGTHNFVANGIVAHNSLEQDADIVLFLYRDDVYNPDSQDRGTAEVIVAKHRNGPVGKVRLAWLDHYTKFANMAKGV
jgi:replicative DNA helicase